MSADMLYRILRTIIFYYAKHKKEFSEEQIEDLMAQRDAIAEELNNNYSDEERNEAWEKHLQLYENMEREVKKPVDNKEELEWQVDQLRKTIKQRKDAYSKKAKATDDEYFYGKANAYDVCLKDIGDFSRHLANKGLID